MKPKLKPTPSQIEREADKLFAISGGALNGSASIIIAKHVLRRIARARQKSFRAGHIDALKIAKAWNEAQRERSQKGKR
jgi:hypothetical protein